MNLTKGQGLPDFVMLDSDKVNENAFMDNLKLRFGQQQIYTYIGEQVVSMNPFQKLDIYDQKTMEGYKRKYMYEVQPHIFALADDTFRSLMSTKRDQCVIVTGESGAGKTEASKYFMQYLAKVSAGSEADTIKVKLLDSNPVLEAFGNAKTIRNDNSSRFGKYMEIQFDGAGKPLGGTISQYLLEKSRVVTRAKGERAFHIFYQLLSQDKLCAANNLKPNGGANYAYLSLSGCYTIDGLSDASEFDVVKKAMVRLGFSDDTMSEIWRVLGAILHLGNIDFIEAKQANTDWSAVKNMDEVEATAALLRVDPKGLEKVLRTRMITSGVARRASRISVLLTPKQAADTRNSLAKALYNAIFSEVTEQLNKSIVNNKIKPEVNVGILDIYGFEIFETNSFEQFCINYCNEKLQQLFIQLVLKMEQEEYVREGIVWTNVDYFDNAPIVELIEGKQGLFKILDESCMVGQTTPQQALDKFNSIFTGKAHYDSYATAKDNKKMKQLDFRIKHYAGVVDYSVEEFLDKNRDTLFADLCQLISTSTDKLVQPYFPVPKADASKKMPVTAGTQFVLNVGKLVEKLNSCVPHYIRCIKSNSTKSAFKLDEELVRHQVRYLNLVETVRVRRAGFCNRQPYERFFPRYHMICSKTWPLYKGGSPRDGVALILKELGVDPEEFRMGKTKLFIRNAKTLFYFEEMRASHMPKVAIFIQKHYKGFKQRVRYKKVKLALALQKLWRGHVARKTTVQAQSALTIQRSYRGFRARKFVKSHKEQLLREREEKRRLAKAIKIQKAIRKWFLRRYVRLSIKVYATAGTNVVKHPVFPRPTNAALRPVEPIFKKMARNYWAKMKIATLAAGAPRELMRQKIATLGLFAGHKPWDPSRPFTADYMDVDANPHQKEFERAVQLMFQKFGDREIQFADVCIKVNRKGKSQEQAILVTDQNIYKYHATKYKIIKKGSPLNDVRGILLSPFHDSFMVIVFEHARDMVLDLGTHNCERYSELATVLVQKIESITGKRISVEFKSSFSYNNSREGGKKGTDMTLTFQQKPATDVTPGCQWVSGKGNSGVIMYPPAPPAWVKSSGRRDESKH